MRNVDWSERVRRYFDDLGDQEWTRLTQTPRDRVGMEVHRRFVQRFVRPGDRVLEVGAGPGRFTLQLAELGAKIVVTDISPVQLRLNEEHLRGTVAEDRVERRELLDVCDTTRYDDREFSAVVAYGGALSYAFDVYEEALRGLLRVTRPGGTVVASVLSLLGLWRAALPAVVARARLVGEDANEEALRTGDLRLAAVDGQCHVCRLFRWSDVEDLVPAAGGRIIAASASNWASLGDPASLAEIEADPDRWARFLAAEVAACEEPGTLDGGTRILFAARHRLGH
ncbi:class I SAM-dependent methyltransferase [Actinomadura craniellae]|uniref:Class I SAM-dependent methyltransferase n=1 Tax=Actinomadura craniellae TaxID=2231787 RepID=A0A365GZB5_9ACTN|nr:class I SAM-dependent methyltransferase [Actinomadura craniellae]RAY12136.1 class I SAM-dependent methyltransferase [Actinomadura craniellae]